MNFSHFFIKRPIFAGVLSILIFIVGLISMYRLPISEYPEVVPPQIVVRAVYPGANPKTISETVAVPLEQQLNGVENSLYTFSQATSDGVMTLTVTFKLGTDIDQAQVLVQNRVSQALPKLPEEVRRLGVLTIKSTPDLTMVVHLFSPDASYDDIFIRNYATLQVKDVLARVDGVGQVQIFGSGDYAMRVWLDPDKVASKGLTPGDVVNAIREQNVQVAAGAIGQQPVSSPAAFELQINTRGRLVTEAEFGDIIVKRGAHGETVQLRDVARIELGAGEFALRSLLNNRSAVAIPVFQQPGSNALKLSRDVREAMETLKRNFPAGLDYAVVYDPTVFVDKSIDAVIHTLFEAIALVVVVVLVFLQTWRASIIPLAAVPVSLVGTFAVMAWLGFTINALSLFGLVLAIGIVVDDAIVVVENVERNIALGLSPVDATRKAMNEVTGPIVATALVLCAVFIPTAFISGLSGMFYKQFAITIAISTVISAFNSLTLSPALSALLLRDHHAPKDAPTRVLDAVFGWFFRPFNRFFDWASRRYSAAVARVIRVSAVALFVYAGLVVLTGRVFQAVPAGFIPNQDKQFLICVAQLPDAASLDRTDAVIRRMSDLALKVPGVAASVAFPGLSPNGFTASPNSGIAFITLDDFEKRTTPDKSADAIIGKLYQALAEIQEARMIVIGAPAVNGLSTGGGFKLFVEDRANLGPEALFGATWGAIGQAYQTNVLQGVYSTYQINVPQIDLDVDRVKAKSLGVPLGSLFETMQIYLGSLYVNDFNRFGRTFQVVAQADAPFRDGADDISRLRVRNEQGRMVPLGTLVKVRDSFGPDRVMRYNGYPAAEINGAPAPGFSSGQAEQFIEDLVRKSLPPGMAYEWTELTYQQRIAGNTAAYIFPLCILLVFLVLAAQYESLSLPLAIILIVPMTLLSAMVGVLLKGSDNNIFTQIGLIVLVGLACKNAILIVEFAREKQHEGLGPVEAALEACKLRLRPILMTSIAFIAGVYPLVVSTGAGSEMRQAMGVAVFAGMIGVTFFGLFLTPVFYVVIMKMTARLQRKSAPVGPATKAVAAATTLALLLAGFPDRAEAGSLTVGPDYRRPTNSVPAAFENTGSWKAGEPKDTLPKGAWWTLFADAELDRLMAAANTNNQQVLGALARIDQARAYARLARSEFFPALSFDPSWRRERLSPNQFPNFGSPSFNTLRVPVDLSYEIDLWGRVRRSFEGARSEAQAGVADFANVLLSVQSELAQTYFTLRSTDNQRGIVRDTLRLRTEALAIVRSRLDAGSATELDLARAETERASAEVELAGLDRSRASLETAIAVLVGVPAPGFHIADSGHYHPEVPAVPAGLPSDLLERRPDVARAERRLAAANSRIGIAKASFFPSLRLTGSGGVLSADMDTLFKWDSRTWAIGPTLTLPLFQGGRNRSDLTRARAGYDEAVSAYRQQVLVAFAEVQENLSGLKSLHDQAVAAEAADKAAGRAVELARARHDAGASSQLEVIDADRTALAVRRESARIQGQRRVATVQLVKALGGGWDGAALAAH